MKMALRQAYTSVSSAHSVMSDYSKIMLNIICTFNVYFFDRQRKFSRDKILRKSITFELLALFETRTVL